MSIRRYALYNLAGSILPIGLTLLTVPAYIGLIGESRYGVLAIAWLLLGYFGLFDLGLGRATAQRVAALRDASAQERAATFWTAVLINAGLGVLGALVLWPVAHLFFTEFFEVEGALRPELRAAVPWLALAVPVMTLSGVLTGALQGRERFLELNLVSVLGTALFQLLPLSVAWFIGPDLRFVLPAAIGARLITLLGLSALCQRHLLAGCRPVLDRAGAGHLLRFGGWVSVTALVGPLMVILDRFVIGALLGAKAVAYYTVPFQLAERSTLLPVALSSALFPRLAAGDAAERDRLAKLALSALLVLMTPAIVVGLLLIEPFLVWWLDAEFARQAAVVGIILLPAFWVNSLARIPLAQLQGAGRPDSVAKCHLLELLPYLALLYAGLASFGLAGAALAFGLRVSADFVLLSALAGIIRATGAVLVPSALILLAVFLALSLSPGSAAWWAASTTHVVGTLGWAWWRAPPAVRGSMLNMCIRLRSYVAARRCATR